MPDTAVTLDFGDARYRFWLPMARVVEIERLCGDKSILTMHDEMSFALGIPNGGGDPVFVGGGSARIADIYQVIRCAAIGGKERYVGETTTEVSALDAKRLVDEYVDGQPIGETLPVAHAILQAAIHGVRLKKKADEPADDPNP